MLNPTRFVAAGLRRYAIDATRVPGDLARVTCIAAGDEEDPARSGMAREGAQAIWSAVERLYATGMHPGISLVLGCYGGLGLLSFNYALFSVRHGAPAAGFRCFFRIVNRQNLSAAYRNASS